MTIPFETTHRVYDLVYADKDYKGEAAFLDSILRLNTNSQRRLLELGCGSGRHALHLNELGYDVTGIDRSDGMLGLARSKVVGREGIRFEQGDIRRLKISGRFDAAFSLFHVMNYVTSNRDLTAVFQTVSARLNPGGVFVFDFWYGPGVLSRRPQSRSRDYEGPGCAFRRSVKPIMQPNRNIVNVIITVEGRELPDGVPFCFKEKHAMRYFFLPELEAFASHAGLKLTQAFPWGGKGRLALGTWNACVVFRKP